MYPLYESTLLDVDSLLIFLLSSLSNSGCVDYTSNDLSASFDYLHSRKMLILKKINCKSINVGYTLFSVISQDIVRFD
jgi:hypothetical protein